MPRITVLLADDDTIVADGLASLLKEVFDVVGAAHDGRQLVDAARQLRPAVIVTDISMPLLNGLDAVHQLRAEGVPSKVIVSRSTKRPSLLSKRFAPARRATC